MLLKNGKIIYLALFEKNKYKIFSFHMIFETKTFTITKKNTEKKMIFFSKNKQVINLD